jgi:hypothetical protein
MSGEKEWFYGACADERRMERCYWRRIGFVIFVAIVMGMLLLSLGGCAEDRWLTKEEDAEMRQNCEATGCVAVPVPLWNQIKRTLGLVES